MKRRIATLTALMLCGLIRVPAAGLVTFQAESGTLGSDWAVSNSTSPAYITIQTDGAGYNPGSAARVATYAVTFPAAGTYQLYARIRVGPGGYNDDSMFFAAGFGGKSPATDSDWFFVNGLAGVGFSNGTDVVTGGGSLGSGMWKWLNLSQFTSQSGFTVSAGNLTQTFQIGARENGLDLDQFAFGTVGTAFTVSNLDSGTLPVEAAFNTNLFIGPAGITLHRFSAVINGLNQDGANPAAGLVFSGGQLVGTTLNGGSQGAGVVFTVSLDGTNFSAVRAFTNAPDAGAPQSELVLVGNSFFSASFSGGANGSGTVFLGSTNGSLSVIRSLAAVSADSATNVGGASPSTQIALSGGMIYGTAFAGGAGANGAVFAVSTNGSLSSVLHDFSPLDAPAGTNSDGALPRGGVVLSGGTLYGTTAGGGAGGSGVVFSVSTNGANFTVLHSFAPMDSLTGTNADGAMPFGGLILLSNQVYGTTCAGGFGGGGTIFAVQTNGVGFTVLHHFTGTGAITGTNLDGASPFAGLLLSSNCLFGTTAAGGTGATGTIFQFDLSHGRFDVIRNFSPLSDNGTNAEGAFPAAPLLRTGNLLCGTTFSGGPGASGTVFSIPVPPPPAIITRIIRNLDGTLTLYFLGGADSTNVIQAAANMVFPMNWQNISTNVADAGGAWQFTDNAAGSTRYYRSYVP